MRLVCDVPPDTPADFPSQVTRPHGGVALAASRSRSNEPPRQIEDGAHKLLRAAATCAEPRPRAHALSLRVHADVT